MLPFQVLVNSKAFQLIIALIAGIAINKTYESTNLAIFTSSASPAFWETFVPKICDVFGCPEFLPDTLMEQHLTTSFLANTWMEQRSTTSFVSEPYCDYLSPVFLDDIVHLSNTSEVTDVILWSAPRQDEEKVAYRPKTAEQWIVYQILQLRQAVNEVSSSVLAYMRLGDSAMSRSTWSDIKQGIKTVLTAVLGYGVLLIAGFPWSDGGNMSAGLLSMPRRLRRQIVRAAKANALMFTAIAEVHCRRVQLTEMKRHLIATFMAMRNEQRQHVNTRQLYLATKAGLRWHRLILAETKTQLAQPNNDKDFLANQQATTTARLLQVSEEKDTIRKSLLAINFAWQWTRKQLASAKDNLASAEKQIIALRSDLAQASDSLSELRTAHDTTREQQAAKLVEKEELSKIRSEFDEKYKSMSDAHQSVSAQFANLERTSSAQLVEKQSLIDNLRKELRSLQTDVSQLTAQKSEAQAKTRDAVSASTNKDREIADLRRTTKEHAAQLTGEIRLANAEIRVLKDAEQASGNALSVLRSEIEALSQKQEQSQNELKSANNRAKQANDRADGLQAELTKVDSEIHGLQSQKELVESQLEDANDQLSMQAQEASTAPNIDPAEVATLKDKLSQFEATKNKLEANCKAVEKSNARLMQDVQDVIKAHAQSDEAHKFELAEARMQYYDEYQRERAERKNLEAALSAMKSEDNTLLQEHGILGKEKEETNPEANTLTSAEPIQPVNESPTQPQQKSSEGTSEAQSDQESVSPEGNDVTFQETVRSELPKASGQIDKTILKAPTAPLKLANVFVNMAPWQMAMVSQEAVEKYVPLTADEFYQRLREGRCTYCNETDHIRENCLVGKVLKLNRLCLICRKFGHEKKACPSNVSPPKQSMDQPPNELARSKHSENIPQSSQQPSTRLPSQRAAVTTTSSSPSNDTSSRSLTSRKWATESRPVSQGSTNSPRARNGWQKGKSRKETPVAKPKVPDWVYEAAESAHPQ